MCQYIDDGYVGWGVVYSERMIGNEFRGVIAVV